MSHKWVFNLCIFTIFLVLFNFAVISMSVVYILSDLGSSSATASYATVFYGLGNVLTVPLAIPFRNRIGVSKFFAISWGLYILATLLAATAPTYPAFIVYRLLQGVASGPLLSLLNNFLLSMLPVDEKPNVIKCNMMLFIIAPILGASWGGWISYDYNWRYIFSINVIVMLISGIILYSHLRKYRESLERASFDKTAYASYILAAVSLTFFITLGQELDWFRCKLITFTFLIFLASLAFLILRTYHHPNSILGFDLLKKPLILLSLINLWVLYGTYFGMTLLLSIWLTLYVRFTVIWVATILGVMVFSAALLMHVTRHYLQTHKVWIPLGLAIILLAFSCFYTSNFNIDINLGRIAFSRIIAGFSFALFLPSLFHLLVCDISAEDTPRAFGLFQVTRSGASALGATIFYTIWIRRQVFYYERLGGNLTKFSPITDRFFIRAKEFGLSKAQMDPQLDEFLQNQATSLALNDCFYLMGWITVLLFILFLISYAKKKALHYVT